MTGINKDTPNEVIFELNFHSNRRKAWLDLIKSGDVNSNYYIDNKEVTFEFKDITLVHQIIVSFSGEARPSKIKVQIEDYKGSRHTLAGEIIDDSPLEVIYDFGKFVKKIIITKNTNISDVLTNIILNKVAVRGWTVDEWKNLEDFALNHFEYKVEAEKINKNLEQGKIELDEKIKKINEIEKKHSENVEYLNNQEKIIQVEIENLQDSKKILENEIANVENFKKQLTEEVENIKHSINTLGKSRLNVESIIVEKNQDLKNINTSISNQKNILDKLNKDVSLFSEDIQGYFKQANNQIINSFLVICTSIIALVILFIWNVTFTSEIFQTFKLFHFKVKILDMIYIRLFSLVSTGIISSFLYWVSKPFIIQILEINKKKLRISEISILTRDVIEASAEDIELTDEDKFRERVGFRKELIREYLSGKFESTSSSFGTDGKKLNDAIKTIVDSSLNNSAVLKAIQVSIDKFRT